MASSLCKTCTHEQVCKYTEDMDKAGKFMEQAVEDLKSMLDTRMEEGIITANPYLLCNMYLEYPLTPAADTTAATSK